MKNMKKKVTTMVFAAMMTISASAFAATPTAVYSENGDYEAIVNTDSISQVQTERHGYSENGDYTAVVITNAPQTTRIHAAVGYSENGEYQAVRV